VKPGRGTSAKQSVPLPYFGSNYCCFEQASHALPGRVNKVPSEKVKVLPRYVESHRPDVQDLIL
jgi:hypothetical protein